MWLTARRQATNCTPEEIQELKNMGVNVEKSQIDCLRSRNTADKGKKNDQQKKKNKNLKDPGPPCK